MELATEFYIMKHNTVRRRPPHYDLRIRDTRVADSWFSFAVPKNLSEARGERRLGIKVADHSTECARFTGTIESGYGAGYLEVWDHGPARYRFFDPDTGKIELYMMGRKIHGIYVVYPMPSKGLLGMKEERKQQLYIIVRKDGKK
jgi:DNA ligase D-like protein (predicted 3'-phosphoesterase)